MNYFHPPLIAEERSELDHTPAIPINNIGPLCSITPPVGTECDAHPRHGSIDNHIEVKSPLLASFSAENECHGSNTSQVANVTTTEPSDSMLEQPSIPEEIPVVENDLVQMGSPCKKRLLG